MTESSCSCMLVPRPRTNPPPTPRPHLRAVPVLNPSIAHPPRVHRLPPMAALAGAGACVDAAVAIKEPRGATVGWGDGDGRAPS